MTHELVDGDEFRMVTSEANRGKRRVLVAPQAFKLGPLVVAHGDQRVRVDVLGVVEYDTVDGFIAAEGYGRLLPLADNCQIEAGTRLRARISGKVYVAYYVRPVY